MRLARHQQHAQLVAHAVDRDHRAVVDLRELAFERRGLDLDDIRARMRDRHVDLDVGAHGDGALFHHVAVAPHGDLRRADLGALILDAEADGLRLADDAEARRLRQHHAAVDLVAVAGDQRMQRRGKAERRRIGRHVVHAAVGDHDGAGDAVGRHVGQRRGQCREQPRAVGLAVRRARFGDAHFQAGNALEPLDQRSPRAASVCALRSPKFWLGLLSTMTAATEGIGSRSSRVSDGLASASTISRERQRAHRRAAAARQQQHDRNQHGRAEGRPHHVGRHQRSE